MPRAYACEEDKSSNVSPYESSAENVSEPSAVAPGLIELPPRDPALRRSVLFVLRYGFKGEQHDFRRHAKTHWRDARADSRGHKQVMVVFEHMAANPTIAVIRRFDHGTD